MALLKRRPLIKQPAQFIARLSTLLQEGYTFEESIRILSPYHVEQVDDFHQTLREAFTHGQTPTEILAMIGVRKRFLYAIAVAESTGDLAGALQKISEEMQFYEETWRRMRGLLSYPIFLFLFVTVLFIAYRRLFLPRMETMLYNRSIADVKSLQLSQFFLNVPDVIVICAGVIVVGLCMFLWLMSRKHIGYQLKMYSSIPLIGERFKEFVTLLFARELGNLLLHGFSLQEALALLSNQQYHKYIAYIAQRLLQHVKNGDLLSTAVKQSEYLSKRFEQFIVHGEHSGMLGRELLIFADLLSEKLQMFMKTSLKIIQPAMLAIIAICVLAAYLSILLPIYNMIEFV